MSALRAAVFLDKDGTLVVNEPYSVAAERLRLAPGAAEALASLASLGYLLFVISNQSGVARGLFSEADLGPVEQRLRALAGEAGVPIAGFYYCPHHPAGTVPRYAVACSCRKPEPGMILRAAAEHGVDLAASWMIGDILDDVEAGRRAGCRSVLVDSDGETEWVLTEDRVPHAVVGDLPEAARLIEACRP
jgi:D-glycero-D-manno-heptose 1,7-bisphosphate phosphatase